ncbi:hypothetical protein GCM10017044_23850 [Kordiimonas sediminis]|uniref:Tetratricopeptide repeat protein n=2 Tax=Kordiimonas sediminis TaxID=1735581 RepID=A0A919AWC0_9PROT|nr:hypothetical protein GCM10017044_23850 [Kordiimonas sediminis]
MHILRIISLGILCIAVTACTTGPRGDRNSVVSGMGAKQDPEGLVEVGKGFERAGDYVGALSMYQQALQKSPEMIKAQLGIARVLDSAGRADEAASILRRLEGLHPENKAIKRQLAFTYASMRRFDAALAVATKLIVDAEYTPIIHTEDGMPTETGDFLLLDLAGRLSEVTGQSANARDFYDKSLAITPSALQPVQHLALSFALDGNFDTAVAMLQPPLRFPPTKEDAQRTLALIYGLSDQPEAAYEITRALDGMEKAAESRSFYILLPSLPKAMQAEAVLFGGLEKDKLDQYFENVS